MPRNWTAQQRIIEIQGSNRDGSNDNASAGSGNTSRFVPSFAQSDDVDRSKKQKEMEAGWHGGHV